MHTPDARQSSGSRSKGWRLAAVSLLCGGVATMVGLMPAASNAAAPRTTTLLTVPTISTIAGNGTNNPPTPGPALSSSVGFVDFGIAVDRFGNVYLADHSHSYVYKVTPGGTLSIFAGDGTINPPIPGPATSSPIGRPEGLAFDRAGNLYIADNINHRVYKVTPDGTLSIFAGNGGDVSPTPGPALSEPIGSVDGLAFDPWGNLLIVSFDNNQVYAVTPGGALSIFAGNGTQTAPTPGPALQSSIGFAEGIAVDGSGNVYITDQTGYYVYKVTPGGTLSIFAGTGTAHAATPGPATSTPVGQPEYVAVDGNGNVFVTDDSNDLLYEITPNGTLSIYAGIANNSAAATPGPASASTLGTPHAIGIDPASGALYVSDIHNLVVNRITPAPGYWLAGAGGFVSGVNGAVDHGSLSTPSTNPVVGIAGDSAGYWVVTRNGSVHAYGDAGWYKDLPAYGVHVSNIVAIAPTQDRRGYWLIGSDGGEFAFGDATYHGSLPGLHVHVTNVVGMVANPNGTGYIQVGSDGGVFVFGGNFYGSLPGLHVHVSNIRGILPTGAGTGYVLVGSDGGAFIFGHGTGFFGSLPGQGIHVNDVVGLALTADQGGYWMAEANGAVHPFGDAPSLGTPAGSTSHLPVAGIAAS
jgi:sugar lactone lactonase YvrE